MYLLLSLILSILYDDRGKWKWNRLMTRPFFFNSSAKNRFHLLPLGQLMGKELRWIWSWCKHTQIQFWQSHCRWGNECSESLCSWSLPVLGNLSLWKLLKEEGWEFWEVGGQNPQGVKDKAFHYNHILNTLHRLARFFCQGTSSSESRGQHIHYPPKQI